MSTIFCFSSTGNSLDVAKSIAKKINANVLSMSKPVRVVRTFVFPVYFWGLPKIVAKFVSNLQIHNKDAYIFAVTTYGGAAFGVTGALNQILMPKGVSLQYRNRIKCVENYTPMYKINDTREIHQKTESMLKAVMDNIAGKKSNKPESYTFINTIILNRYGSEIGDPVNPEIFKNPEVRMKMADCVRRFREADAKGLEMIRQMLRALLVAFIIS